jgi:hypothetical protein
MAISSQKIIIIYPPPKFIIKIYDILCCAPDFVQMRVTVNRVEWGQNERFLQSEVLPLHFTEYSIIGHLYAYFRPHGPQFMARGLGAEPTIFALSLYALTYPASPGTSIPESPIYQGSALLPYSDVRNSVLLNKSHIMPHLLTLDELNSRPLEDTILLMERWDVLVKDDFGHRRYNGYFKTWSHDTKVSYIQDMTEYLRVMANPGYPNPDRIYDLLYEFGECD